MNVRNVVCLSVALAVQCLGIAWLIGRYENIVRNGTEVRFRCGAYDPSDPLRGRYLRVSANETCTRLPKDVLREDGHRAFHEKWYAKLEPGGTNGLWRVSAIASEPQAEGVWVKPDSCRIEHQLRWSDQRKGESWEAFRRRRENSPLVARVEFPGVFFIDERLAPEAEKALAEATGEKGKGAVAVYRVKNRHIVLTGIEIDGKPVTAWAREKGAVKE